MKKAHLHLFDAYGLELEYMIVNKGTFDVMPISDWLLAQHGTVGAREVERGLLMWSNELAMHVIELKGNGPVEELSSLTGPMQESIRYMNSLLAEQNACLMGSAVHPWMNPDSDTRLWQLEDAPIYDALNKAFGCQGHSWFNLQSAHLNLPFANDEEFARLHAAIRLVLPIIPALAAASPFLDGKDTGVADARLNVYSRHCNRVPEAIGDVIPEPVTDREEYERIVLQPLYRALAPKDPEGILQFEWSNARGAIARFDRNAIEVRLIDVQEHPLMDAGVVSAVAAAVKVLTEQALLDLTAMNGIPTAQLRAILNATVQHAENTRIQNTDYIRLVTGGSRDACSAARLWRTLLARCEQFTGTDRRTAEWIIDNGTLATRMRRACGSVNKASLKKLAGRLCQSLETGEALTGRRL